MTAWLLRNKILLSNLALVLVMLVGVAYLSLGVLRWRPLADSYSLTVEFANSGGVQTTSDVTLRGARVGEVDTILTTPTAVEVKVTIDSKYKINKDAAVEALGLSAVGEQYVDFQPSTDAGPYFSDGDKISTRQTSSTVAFPKLLESTVNVVNQIDPDELKVTIDELDVALDSGGKNQLRALFNSGGVIFADLYRVLPETVSLIQNTGTILETTSDVQPDLGTLTGGISSLIDSLVASDQELRTFLGSAPAQLTTLGGSLNTLTDPLTDVLKQFLDIAQQGALRAPALVNLLPSIRDGAITSLSMFHDGAWWAYGSIYPRPYCDYPVLPQPPTEILQSSVPVNMYCVTEDPTQQIRGAANAPRPPGDDTAGPPPNFDPNARTAPLG
ncbi:MAG: virulence factor Mce [Gordonia sp.]|uniref:MCE family protein n=1 Tax=Gordonia rubripertincta TaxID=36822 RepID=A0ABT4MT02_GORRU|nr:MCE family protein [Gordonia rubripertincta]MBA4022494.1 virulence factor Mce [Gordonia sp. (in: high G+C Gram-positive bacteria)]MCZ4549131.1 MCE family protein [Gordonia rubripertincta]